MFFSNTKKKLSAILTLGNNVHRDMSTFDFHHVEQMVTKKLQSVILEDWEVVWLAENVILD